MPRLIQNGLFLLAGAIPLILFCSLPDGKAHADHGRHFFLIDFDGTHQGRGHHAGGFQGGGFHVGK